MKKLMVLMVGLVLAGCTADEETTRTLHNAGFTDVQTTGYVPFACGQDDNFHTGLKARVREGFTVVVK